jgi:uncharacterized protein with PQ loop repeat
MNLELVDLVGAVATVYGIGGALSILLQARQMLARGASCEVSLRFLGVYVGGYAIWLLYGVSVGSVPIVLVHALGLVCGTVTLAVALRLRGPLFRPGRWAECA